MYLLLFSLLELYSLRFVPLNLNFASVLCLSAIAIYSLWYFDGKEYTGERRWEAFRSLKIWQWISPVDLILPEKNDFQTTRGKRLFVFIPCATPSSLIWSVGLHGGNIQFKQTVHYVLPPIFLWIPLVRDVLLWTGAITYSNHKASQSKIAVITEMLNQGRAVCYTPSNFADRIITSDLESNIEARYPSEDMLKLAIDENIQIVPVVVQGEFERYKIVQNNHLKSLQSFAFRHLDYPFPLFYWYKWYSHTRPPLVFVQFGAIMSAQVYETTLKLKDALKDKVSRLTQPSLGDKEIKPL